MKTIDLIVSDKEIFRSLSYLGASPEYTEAIIEQRETLARFGLTNAHRWSVFLGQCAHESAHFTAFEENLNYSAHALMATWPSRYRTEALAKADAHQPKKIAARVYGGRMGNQTPEEGYLYRGRGPLMLTGRNNYAAAGKFLKLDLLGNPDQVAEDPIIGLLTALWYFSRRKYQRKCLLDWCDELSYRTTTKLINGGYLGLAERKKNIRAVLAYCGHDEGLYTQPLIRQGDRGSMVREIQVYLKDLGFLHKADGVYGRGTRKAVLSFQRGQELTEDGVVGGMTMDALLREAYLTEIKD